MKGCAKDNIIHPPSNSQAKAPAKSKKDGKDESTSELMLQLRLLVTRLLSRLQMSPDKHSHDDQVDQPVDNIDSYERSYDSNKKWHFIWSAAGEKQKDDIYNDTTEQLEIKFNSVTKERLSNGILF